jgi:VWFA-related protein
VNRPHGAWLVAVLAGLVWSAAATLSFQQRSTFRGQTARVSVDVSVKRGKVPVAGLGASDFELTDNNVRQQIELVSVEAIPIDVTLVVDTSGSVIGNLGAFKDEVRRFARMLRSGDRLRVVSFSTAVVESVPMQEATKSVNLDNLTGNGMTSLNDGLIYALLWPEQSDRRHLVIALTDGEDTMSTLNSETIPDVAARVDSVFHVVLVSPETGGFRTTWMEGSLKAIREAVRRSGGDEHRLSRAANDFKTIFDDFRASYVLWYAPTGVPDPGWHDVMVNVVPEKGGGDVTIRARKGYFATRGPA